MNTELSTRQDGLCHGMKISGPIGLFLGAAKNSGDGGGKTIRLGFFRIWGIYGRGSSCSAAVRVPAFVRNEEEKILIMEGRPGTKWKKDLRWRGGLFCAPGRVSRSLLNGRRDRI